MVSNSPKFLMLMLVARYDLRATSGADWSLQCVVIEDGLENNE